MCKNFYTTDIKCVNPQELSIERLLEMEALVADPAEEFQFLRVGPDSNVPPKYRAPVSSLCQIGMFPRSL